jgi:hypothetical protein
MAQSQRVAQYISDNETDNDMELESSNSSGTVKQKRKQNRRKWLPICTYYSKDGAINKVKTDGIWSQSHTNTTNEGKLVYYRCNKVERRGKQCPAAIYLLYHSENDCVTMFETGSDHSHDESKLAGINGESRLLIDELFKLKVKPKRILETLEEKGLPVPLKKQLSNYLVSLRKKLYGSSSISLGELEAWCQRNAILPDDDDQPWVLRYQIEYENEIDEDNEESEDDGNKF